MASNNPSHPAVGPGGQIALQLGKLKLSPTSTRLVYTSKCASLQHPEQVQYDEYDGDDDQRVDPIAGLWEAWADPPTEKAEQPQDEQNYDDGPYHEISPFE
jgi:hypothetical protein